MYAGFLAVHLLLPQVPVVLLPCVQSDSTAVCHCKQGMVSACAALTDSEAEMLKGLARAAAMVKAAQDVQKTQAQATDAVDTGCGSGQDPNDDDARQKCTGQMHHIISMTVWKALELHLVLRGHYTYRDPHFVAQGKDLKAHCGYQDWHRAIDAEIEAWLKKFTQATMKEFEAYLRDLYARPELRARFPNGF